MQSISDKTGSGSSWNFESENRYTKQINGRESKARYKKQIQAIKAANSKMPLFHLLKHYNISIERTFKNQTWSNLITCPLVSHKQGGERTPSFGYNFVEDRFYCFGCKSFGRAVEFLSIQESKNKSIIAERILDQYADSDYIDSFDNNDEYIDIEEKLIFIASEFRNLYCKYYNDKSKLSELDKISWWFDIYLAIKTPEGEINVEELSVRAEKVLAMLENI